MLPSQPGLGWNQLPLVGQAGYIQIFWHLAAWLEKDKNAEIKGGSMALGRTEPSPFTDPAEALQPRGHQATQAHSSSLLGSGRGVPSQLRGSEPTMALALLPLYTTTQADPAV